MGFVFDAGNSAIGKAAQGAAEGIETSRRIQDQQQAREMAMTELQLRQQRGDMAMDQFAENLRRNQAQEARADLRLVSDIENRKLSQSIAQQRFDAITRREDRELEADKMRGEANTALLKAMGDGTSISDSEYATLQKSVSQMDPALRAEVLFKAKGMRAAQEQRDLQARIRNLASQEKYILGSASSPEESAALQEELLAAQIRHQGDAEGYADAVNEMQGLILRASSDKKAVERWGAETLPRIDASIKDVDERQEAYALREQALSIGAENPGDPRVQQYKQRIDWLSTPKDVRQRTMDSERKEREMAATMTAIGWGGREQMERLTRVHLEQRAIGVAVMGEEFARTEEERGRELVAGLKAAGLDVDLDVLLPADKALPQQLLYAFQSFDVANQAMQGASSAAVNAHMTGLFERAGVVADKDAAELYMRWKDNPSILDTSSIDMDKVLEADIYKMNERKGTKTDAQVKRAEESEQWLRIFKHNLEMDKVGGKKIPQGPPPLGAERIARSLGWDGGTSVWEGIKESGRDFIEAEDPQPALLEQRGFGAAPDVVPINDGTSQFLDA